MMPTKTHTRDSALPLFKARQRSAIERGLLWDLTSTMFAELINRPCFYCGVEGASGLDRTDNLVGYTPENVVPCCGVCNMVKGSTFTADEMVQLGAVITQIRAVRPLRLGDFARPKRHQRQQDDIDFDQEPPTF